jgi:membrane-associated phospholipid phosphatase
MHGRAVLTAVISCAVLIGLSILFLDRPLSTWSHATLHRASAFIWLSRVVEPVPFLAVFGLTGTGAAAVFGWRPGPAARVFIACCLATLLTIGIKAQLQFAFGRTWPETWTNGNPSWITDGVFGFDPFHGGKGWESFPSGHSSVIAAPMAVLWQRAPGARWLWSAVVALVAIGLIGADFHWLSDIVAGLYLGTAVGVACSAIFCQREPTVTSIADQ